MELKKMISDIAIECGDIMRSAHEQTIRSDRKTGFRDLVTEYDRRIQAYAVERLSQLFPSADFICEEDAAFLNTKEDSMKEILRKRMMGRLAVMLALTLLLSACGAGDSGKTDASESADREVINQVSLLQGLTFGDYNGSVPVSRLRELGDTGIGTFDALNGELIMLDGTVYRAAHDGSVEEVPDDETVPFANTTFFDGDETFELSGIDSVDSLKAELDKKVGELGSNRFYMIRVDGVFGKMSVRSELPQSEPYKPLAEVLETDQTFFDYSDVKGTVVGLYCPEYMNDINAVGWHFHFISEDRAAGGHVLDLSADALDVSMDRTDGFNMLLPDNDMFNNFDLTVDQSDDIKKVETGED